MRAIVINKPDKATLENIEHARDLVETKRRQEVRRQFKRIQRLNAEQERKAQGWEPGFHNRVRGFARLGK